MLYLLSNRFAGHRLDNKATTSIEHLHVNYGIECISKCAKESTKSCRSVNYKKYSTCEEEPHCELLKTVDAEEPEENLKQNENYDYYILETDRVREYLCE